MTRSERISLFVRRRSVRLSAAARAELLRPPLAGEDQGPLRTHVVGRDPLRVLLFGSGALTGYGVRTRRDAVDGHLAELLADVTGRGVIVESRVRLDLPIAEAVPSLGAAGTATFGVALWAPRFGEEMQRARVEQRRAAVRAMLHAYRAESAVPLVLCHLPKPLGHDWRSTLRRPRVASFNRVLEQEADRATGVTCVDTGSYRPTESSTTLGPEWHRGLAERLLPPVLLALDIGSASIRR